MELIQQKDQTNVLRLREEFNQAVEEQGFFEKTGSLFRLLSK